MSAFLIVCSVFFILDVIWRIILISSGRFSTRAVTHHMFSLLINGCMLVWAIGLLAS